MILPSSVFSVSKHDFSEKGPGKFPGKTF